jgi:hypothetical protein
MRLVNSGAFSALAVATWLATATMTAAQPPTPPDQEPATPPAADGAAPRGPGAAAREASTDPKPYDRVITKDAKSDEGVFTVHRVKDKVFYEIPASELGKEFLWVTQIAQTTLGVGYGGQFAGDEVVRWDRRDNRVLLRKVSYDVVADKGLPISKAVAAANFDPIVMRPWARTRSRW